MFDRVGKTDPVTRGIEITVNYLGIQFDVCYHRQLTLLYIFWLAKSRLRFLLDFLKTPYLFFLFFYSTFVTH